MSQWEFTGNDGAFRLERADDVRGIYFPIANEAGYMASICPDGGGDAKTDQNHFLTPPVSALDLHNTRLKRNAWVCAEGREPWSITGASHGQKSCRDEHQHVEAGLLWHRSMRNSSSGEYEAEMLTLSPPESETLELSRIRLRNASSAPLELSMISVFPLYGRSADSLRDHRHVTSLLNQVQVAEQGVHLVPTMSFDERGHRKNATVYSVLGCDSRGSAPLGAFPDLEQFIGEAGDAERPSVVFDERYRSRELQMAGTCVTGCEALGALQFPAITLLPEDEYSLYLISGIFSSTADAESAAKKYCSAEGFSRAYDANRAFWAAKTAPVLCAMYDSRFEQWMRWVSVQPILRRIYGCSFLPYHDYGRGGRGWRDLWQDCLALLLMEPGDVRKLLLSNFAGVRFDGTNATIVGSEPGSFIADRNSIPRVWMDHGAWPVLTVKLYIDQTGDLGLLAEEQQYFSDSLWARATERVAVTPKAGAESGTRTENEPGAASASGDGGHPCLRTTQGAVYTGSVFEHLLLQQLSAYFNVGDHNCIRLEGADWNDGLDMATEKGESVAFSSLYAANLLWLAEAVERLHIAGYAIEIAEEILILLDRYTGQEVDDDNPSAKQDCLRRFFAAAKGGPCGRKSRADASALASDLREKGTHLLQHVRNHEWVKGAGGQAWFNGYYDNRGKRVEGEPVEGKRVEGEHVEGKRVEGDASSGTRMTLTGQVFSLLSGAATPEQVKSVIAAADQFLLDPEVGGYRLNTDFGEVKLDLGRCFGFAYGHKENGAMFSHMAVMYAYALYARGETAAASKVMKMMYGAAATFERSRMYPGLPEYFDPKGRGLYCYLTGSASWYLLTVVTQMFGVRGSWGDLILSPQLEAEQWNGGTTVSVSTCFRDRQLRVEYNNPEKLDAGHYRVGRVLINGSSVEFQRDGIGVVIPGSNLPDADMVITAQLENIRSGA
ncbi:MAG: cellobiose phosphorylase [Spirochaetaceae bacterium]|nr:MAG: cellobiose phosphorylase [Spirochaetaceae bacterium]